MVGSPAGQDPSASEPVRITEIRTPGPVHESAAQIKGVLPLPLSALRSTLPVFKNPANRHRAMSLTAEQFRYASATPSSSRSPRSSTSGGDPGARQAAVRGRRRQDRRRALPLVELKLALRVGVHRRVVEAAVADPGHGRHQRQQRYRPHQRVPPHASSSERSRWTDHPSTMASPGYRTPTRAQPIDVPCRLAPLALSASITYANLPRAAHYEALRNLGEDSAWRSPYRDRVAPRIRSTAGLVRTAGCRWTTGRRPQSSARPSAVKSATRP